MPSIEELKKEYEKVMADLNEKAEDLKDAIGMAEDNVDGFLDKAKAWVRAHLVELFAIPGLFILGVIAGRIL